MHDRKSTRTVADLLDARGKQQLSMLRVTSLDEAAAANAAGIEIASVPEALVAHPEYRDAAPDLFSIVGVDFWDTGTSADYIRWAYPIYGKGADAIYCCASTETVRRMADDGVPVCGHVGLVPQRRTWTGGYKAVGKTLESAKWIYSQVRALEDAGAFAAEIEVVPEEIARMTCDRSHLLLISMGSGSGCDAQYLYSEDVLGENRGHMPRHSKVYRNFAAEYDRLQQERVLAFTEFRDDVLGARFPEPRQIVSVDPQIAREYADYLSVTVDRQNDKKHPRTNIKEG